MVHEKKGAGKFITLKDLETNEEKLHLFDQTGNKIETYSISHEPNTIKLFIPKNQTIEDGICFLYSGNEEKRINFEYETFANNRQLRNHFITIEFAEQGTIQSVSFLGEQVMLSGSLVPQIQYGEGKFFSPKELKVEVLKEGNKGVTQVRLVGELSLENTIETGKVNYVLTLIEGVPYLYLDAYLKYPETVRDKVIKPEFASLTRKIDNHWIEVAPSQVKFTGYATKETPFKVIKRNYLGIESSYLIDYFQHSNQNLDLDNVNNHITAEYIALAGEKMGIGIAMDTSVLANFAFCPIKIKYEKNKFFASLNPFGTYYGKQYFHPTWGHRQGFESSFLTGQQYWTSASTYNGYEYKSSLMLSFFSGRELPKDLKKDMIHFAHPIQVIQQKQKSKKQKFTEVKTPQGFIASYGLHPTQKIFGTYFHWEKTKAKTIKIQIGK